MNMKWFGLLILLGLLPYKVSFSQQKLVDSLIIELSGTMADTSRAYSMMRLAMDYEVVDTAKAFRAYEDAIAFASGKKLYYQLGRIYHNKSFLVRVAGRYDEYKSNLEKAIDAYRKSGDKRAAKWEANAVGDIANYYGDINNQQKAVEYNLESIRLFETIGEQSFITTRYYNIANIFSNMREYDKQKEYAHKALSAAKKSNDNKSLCLAYFGLALAYSMTDENRLAKDYIDSSRAYFANNWSIDYMFSYYMVTAQVYRKLEIYDSAYAYFEKSYTLSGLYNYSYGKAEAQLQMGAVSILQKNYQRAESLIKSGIQEAESVNNYNMLDDGYKYLSDIYYLKGNYKLAYEYFQKFKEINDSVVDMESKQYATDLEKKYETEKKENQIHHLKIEQQLNDLKIRRKNLVNFILLGGIFWISLISFLVYRNLKHRHNLQQHRIQELETEKQLMAAEAVLKGEEQERTRIAKDLHDGLGGILSGLKHSFTTMKGNLIMTPENQQAFERGMDMLDSSIKEMRRVAHNMMPEALVRFGLNTALKDFCNDINQSGALKIDYQSIDVAEAEFDQTFSITVYRIIQELINNVLKHAHATQAIVQLVKTGSKLTITVEDNGKGFDVSLLKSGSGIGWMNIQSRVDFLKGNLDITSGKGEGTSVQIELNME